MNLRVLPALVALLALAACAGGPRATPQYFSLDPGPPPSLRALRAAPGATASVSFVDVASPFAANGFVYQLGGGRWEVDPYNQFIVSPADMTTSLLRNWLRDSGLYAEVAQPAAGGGQEFFIDADLTELYGDFRNPFGPLAVVSLEVQVLRRTDKGRVLALRKSLTRSVPVAARTPEALVKAWNEALRIELSELLRAIAELRD